MIRSFRGAAPVVPDSAFASESALVMGAVTLGERCGVWPGAIIRGDFAHIRIGSGTLIEDNVVVHTGRDMTIGDDVIVGHGAVVHCRSIGRNSLIANSPVGDRLGDLENPSILSRNRPGRSIECRCISNSARRSEVSATP